MGGGGGVGGGGVGRGGGRLWAGGYKMVMPGKARRGRPRKESKSPWVVGVEAMAARVGVSRGTISRWIETGRLVTVYGQASHKGGRRPRRVRERRLLLAAGLVYQTGHTEEGDGPEDE